MRLAARGARERESGGLAIIGDERERDRLRQRAAGLRLRAGLIGTLLTVVGAGILLLG